MADLIESLLHIGAIGLSDRLFQPSHAVVIVAVHAHRGLNRLNLDRLNLPTAH